MGAAFGYFGVNTIDCLPPAAGHNISRYPFGGRTCPETMSPVRNPKRRIWDWET